VISEEIGRKLDSTTVQDLGRARKVVSNKDETTVVEGRGSENAIKSRIQQIRTQITETTSDFDKREAPGAVGQACWRRSRHQGRAATEVELKEKKHRVEDALSATRAAVEEGIVPGGGTAFVHSIPALDPIIAGSAAIRRRVQSCFVERLEEPLAASAPTPAPRAAWSSKRSRSVARVRLRRRQGRVCRHARAWDYRSAQVTRSLWKTPPQSRR